MIRVEVGDERAGVQDVGCLAAAAFDPFVLAQEDVATGVGGVDAAPGELVASLAEVRSGDAVAVDGPALFDRDVVGELRRDERVDVVGVGVHRAPLPRRAGDTLT